MHDEVVDVPKEQLEQYKKFSKEPFVTDGCSKVSGFRLEALIYGLRLSIIIVILNSVLQEIITRFVSMIGYDSHTIEVAKIR